MSLLAGLGLEDGSTWGVFIVATAILNATPGVDMLLVVTRTLKAGSRAGLAAALGVGAGCAVHAAAAAFGLAAVLAVSPQWFLAMKALGVGYLLWTAWGLWRVALTASPLPALDARDGPLTEGRSTMAAEFRRGLLTNVLNPKVALFFLAFVPQFIAPQVPHKTAAFLVLGTAFVLQGTLFLALVVALVVALVSRTRTLSVPAIWQRGLHALAGTLFVGLAGRLWSLRGAS